MSEIKTPITEVGNATIITEEHTVSDIVRWAVEGGWADEFVAIYETDHERD